MSVLLAVFVIATVGYLVGSIKIRGVELGTAGVLLVALIFGHFGIETNTINGEPNTLVRDIGLVCFVTAVGFIAGPKFFRNFVKNAKSYVVLGLLIILSGAAACVLIIWLAKIPSALGIGLMTGALTSTPGLAAAIEASGGNDMASIGYGIAYPFGVISVVLFVQLIPKILKVDIAKERAQFEAANAVELKQYKGKLFACDPIGLFPFCFAVMAGLLIAKIVIPLPGGASFSFGTSGGPLIAGLLVGHFSHIGPVDMSVKKKTLESLREFGLMMFLIGAGTEAGKGFVETLQQYGFMLFLYGAIMALVPMVVGYFFATKVLKLSIFNNLGSITGGMTSTPALGTLISVAGTDDVASAYAATYPIALVSVVLASQFIALFM